jgi:hypothetical protein
MESRAARKALLAVATACVTALTATTTGHASTAITLARYDKRADAVCLAYHRKAARFPRVALSDFPGLVSLVRRALPLVTADVAKLRAIPLPRTKRILVRLWLQRHYRIPLLLRALRAGAEKKSLALVRTANQTLQANGAAARSLAQRLGMGACSRS